MLCCGYNGHSINFISLAATAVVYFASHAPNIHTIKSNGRHVLLCDCDVLLRTAVSFHYFMAREWKNRHQANQFHLCKLLFIPFSSWCWCWYSRCCCCCYCCRGCWWRLLSAAPLLTSLLMRIYIYIRVECIYIIAVCCRRRLGSRRCFVRRLLSYIIISAFVYYIQFVLFCNLREWKKEGEWRRKRSLSFLCFGYGIENRSFVSSLFSSHGYTIYYIYTHVYMVRRIPYLSK